VESSQGPRPPHSKPQCHQEFQQQQQALRAVSMVFLPRVWKVSHSHLLQSQRASSEPAPSHYWGPPAAGQEEHMLGRVGLPSPNSSLSASAWRNSPSTTTCYIYLCPARPTAHTKRVNLCHQSRARLYFQRKETPARHQWLIPIILATQEAEIRRITVWNQDPILKKPITK
jgi:hypothetical protein